MPLNITIIGLDAIGASLGLALGTLDQDALPTGRPTITGWDDDKRTLQDARSRLMIDRVASSIIDAVRDADIVFVNVAPEKLAETFNLIAPHLKSGAMVTDVASTKGQALAEAQAYLPTTVDFIGGHPLVTPKSSRLADASIDLFKNTIYCLVSGMRTGAGALDTLAELVTAIGAKPYYIDAEEHDAYIAGVQHLPLVVAAVVMETLGRSGGWREMQPIAGAPFRAATAFASSDPDVNTAICQRNSTALEHWLNQLIRTLVEVRDNLHNPDQLLELFSHAREAHEQWLEAQPNMRPGESEFYNQFDPINENRSLGSLFFGQRKRKPDRGRS